MKRIALLMITLLSASAVQAQLLRPADFVDPFIGTAGMGHTFPGACAPFGGVQVSPDTDNIPHNIG